MAITASASFFVSGDSVTTAAIDCSSGVPDLASGVTGVSKDECQTQCREVCHDVSNSDTLEACLTNSALKGCLFQVNTAQEHEVTFCMNAGTTGTNAPPDTSAPATDAKAQRLVVKIAGEDLYITGKTASSKPGDKVHVSEVNLALQMDDTTLFKSCANKGVDMGISSVKFDAKVCPFEGTLGMLKSYTISNDGKAMIVPVGDTLKGLWGQKEDAVVAVQIKDATCGQLKVNKATAYFSMSYQAGYIDQAICSQIHSCLDCRVANCHWCSWDRTVNSILPEWLPNWEWVQNAKNNSHGTCGLNSAVCRISSGQYDVCAAPPNRHILSIAIGAILLALAAIV